MTHACDPALGGRGKKIRNSRSSSSEELETSLGSMRYSLKNKTKHGTVTKHESPKHRPGKGQGCGWEAESVEHVQSPGLWSQYHKHIKTAPAVNAR